MQNFRNLEKKNDIRLCDISDIRLYFQNSAFSLQ